MDSEYKDQVALAYKSAIRFLSVREHAIQEITSKLTSRKYAIDIIDDVTERLIKQDYLNEQRYSDVYYRSRLNRGYGQKKISYELSGKGIKGSMIQASLEAIDEYEWLDAITKQISKKVTNVPVSFPDKMKLFSKLTNRGYDLSEIKIAYEGFIESFNQ